MDDPLVVAGVSLHSRLLLGTGGAPSHSLLAEAISASGAELVTVAMRRIDPAGGASLLDVIQHAGVRVLPNTAGCYTARDAVVTAKQHTSTATKPACCASAPPAAPPKNVPRNCTLE